MSVVLLAAEQPSTDVGSFLCVIVPVASAFWAPTAIQASISILTIAPVSAPYRQISSNYTTYIYILSEIFGKSRM